jgi:hypothetical protein
MHKNVVATVNTSKHKRIEYCRNKNAPSNNNSCPFQRITESPLLDQPTSPDALVMIGVEIHRSKAHQPKYID